MQRNILALALGASMLGAAALAACSSGGAGSSPAVSAPVGTSGSGDSGQILGSARLTLTIGRTQRAKPAQTSRRGTKGTRKPAYISTQAKGLQVAVSTTGTSPATRTIYADLSSTSPLCTGAGSGSSTCTITIPTLAASELIVATEVDQPPAGSTNGYGTSFPTGSNILAVGTLTTTLTLGTVASLTMGLGPVAGGPFYDCTFSTDGQPAAPPITTANYGFDGGQNSNPGRIVVTAGVASAGLIEPEFGDAANNEGYYEAPPSSAPFADVNGSPTPITVTGSSAAITFAPMVNNGTPPPTGAFTATASIPDDGYQWFNCFFVVAVHVAANISGTVNSVTVNNNLTALNPLLNPPAAYPQTFVYPLAAVTASVMGSPAVTGTVTAQATGTDYLATNGMDAESVPGATDEQCKNGGTVKATVAPSGAISMTTWQQAFTITPVAAGTCTFDLYDTNTGIPTLAVSVTVGP